MSPWIDETSRNAAKARADELNAALDELECLVDALDGSSRQSGGQATGNTRGLTKDLPGSPA